MDSPSTDRKSSVCWSYASNTSTRYLQEVEKKVKKNKKRKTKEKRESLVEAEFPSGAEASPKKVRLTWRETDEENGTREAPCAGLPAATEVQEPRPSSCWKNLDLVLSLRSKDLPLQRKNEIAFEFVTFSESNVNSDLRLQSAWRRQCIGAPRLVAFLCDWVQSVMVPSNEKTSSNGVLDLDSVASEPRAVERDRDVDEPSLDSRCWTVLLHCLKSEHLESLSFSPNVMRSVARVFKETILFLESWHEESERFNLREVLILVSESLSLILGLHGRAYNFNLEVWVSTSVSAVELVHKVLMATAVSNEDGDAFLKVALLFLEAFSNYLAVHPNPKHAFNIFTEKILVPLLLLFSFVMKLVKAKDFQKDGVGARWADRILRITENILSNGLFHSSHIDGFLNLHAQEPSGEVKKDKLTLKKKKPMEESYSMIKSYHKHLFHKLEQLRLDGKHSAFVGVGLLLDLFVRKVAKLEGTFKKSKSAKFPMKDLSRDSGSRRHQVKAGAIDDHKKDVDFASEKVGEVTELAAGLTRLDESVRKSLFDMFAELVKPLLLSVRKYSESLSCEEGVSLECVFSNAHYALESINNLLATLLKDKIYLRAEDTTEGAHFSFLKEISNAVFTLAARLPQLWSYAFKSSSADTAEHATLSASSTSMVVVNSSLMIVPVAKEVIVTLQYFLDIEYRVYNNEMIDVWLLLLSYLAFSLFLVEGEFYQILALAVLQLGHCLINVYSELRQVLKPILALCKSVRLYHFVNDDGFLVQNIFGFQSYLTSEAFIKAVITLLCSWELKVALSDAIKSTPEGQASTLILEIKIDVEETLGWIKAGSSGVGSEENVEINGVQAYCKKLNMQAELFGRGLTELYVIILDSLPVTTGNCISVGNSVKDLMKTIRPLLNILVAVQSHSLKQFLFAVTGRQLSELSATAICKTMPWEQSCLSWIILFFIRLCSSCRSLYRQSFCLMPPNMARKASTAMADLFTAFSGKELTERAEWVDDGYFSWIRKPSIPLLDFVQSMSSFFLEEDCPSLVYVLHTICLERLNDLNRQINALAFLEEKHVRLEEGKSLDSAGYVPYKVRKMWAKLIALSKIEASGLTTFMMEYIYPCLKRCLTVKNSEGGASLVAYEQESWDFGVGSINHHSLPIALWWLICQNVDVWCIHASKRQLKKFSSLLLRLSLPYVFQYFKNFGIGVMDTSASFSKITLHHISLELLNDTLLYEQPFLCRYLTSRCCHILSDSLSPVFSSSRVNFNSLPEWSELIAMVEKAEVSTLEFKDQVNLVSGTKEFTFCHSLLNFSCWMPKVCLGLKDLRTYVAHILNTERLIATSILECQGDLCQSLELFICCRRAFKYLAVCSRTEDLQNSGFSFLLRIFGNSDAILWLLKSVSELSNVSYLFSKEKHIEPVIDSIFTLVQETSNIFFSLTEGQSKVAAQSLRCQEFPGSLSGEKFLIDDCTKRLSTLESDSSRVSEHLDAWKWLKLLAENLTEQTRVIHSILEESKIQIPVTHEDSFTFHWTKLSSLLSCFHGFLWGLISGLDSIDELCRMDKSHSLRWTLGHVSKLKQCIDTFEKFVDFCLAKFLAEDISSPKGFMMESLNGYNPQNGFSCLSCLNQSLLQGILKGRNIVLACLIGQLFTSSAALLKIKHLLASPVLLGCEKNGSQMASASMGLLIGTSLFLLSELAEVNVQLRASSFVCLNGLFKYLEVLGSCFPFIDISSSHDVYAKLIDLHVKVLAKCITLQGRTNLVILEAGLCFERDQLQTGSNKINVSPLSGHEQNFSEFKDRLKMSLITFVKKPMESHFLSVVQVLERALVGVQDCCPTKYNVETGSLSGGRVATTVAAGLECLDMVLESVSSRKCSNILGRHTSNLISAVFNIVIHLQSPLIFLKRKFYSELNGHCADPGQVILICVELLTKLCGWHSHFSMEACHVAQALHLPRTVFHEFCQIKTSQSACNSLLLSTFQGIGSASFGSSSKHDFIVEKGLSVALYVACCRLLCAVVKHWKREVERCIGLLGDSMKVLLLCLESVDSRLLSREDAPLWDLQDAVKCASFFRRIYEEIRLQKDIFGRYASHFLSNYIWIYSGCSQQGTGFRRDIDEALRPGVYALVDICSPPDLQQLHVGLGEGPCRSTLFALKHDYEVKFKYAGKV